MAYQKTVWKDQDVENPRTYVERDNGDGTVTLLDAFGEVTELGTPVNAANMNKIENGIEEVDNSAVHKTGDETISGSKTFTNNITVQLQYPYITNKCSDATKGTALSQYRHSSYMYTDKDGKELAGLINVYDTDKSTYSEIRAYAANSASDTGYSYIRVGKSANGNGYTVAPASDVSNSIVTTISKSKTQNGYFKLGNGLIIQWGRSNQRTITYPIPFSTDTSFSIVVNNQAGTDGYGRPDSVSNLTRTSCMVGDLSGYPVRWIAVGY